MAEFALVSNKRGCAQGCRLSFPTPYALLLLKNPLSFHINVRTETTFSRNSGRLEYELHCTRPPSLVPPATYLLTRPPFIVPALLDVLVVETHRG